MITQQTPTLIMVLAVIWTLVWPTKLMCIFTAGLFGTPVINTSLKYVFRKLYNWNKGLLKNVFGKGGRPYHKNNSLSLSTVTDFGMPSGHSQFAGYLVGFASRLWGYEHFGTLAAYVLGAFLTGSRVIYEHHTRMQAVVGFGFGVCFGTALGRLV